MAKQRKQHYLTPSIEELKLYTFNLLNGASIETGELYGDGEDFTLD